MVIATSFLYLILLLRSKNCLFYSAYIIIRNVYWCDTTAYIYKLPLSIYILFGGILSINRRSRNIKYEFDFAHRRRDIIIVFET